MTAVGRHFSDIDPKLDVLGPLRQPYRRRKSSLLERLEGLVDRRHALIHGMNINNDLDRKGLEGKIHDLTVGVSRVYKAITSLYGWPFELPGTSNFSLGPVRRSRAAEVRPGSGSQEQDEKCAQ